jgi:hypothetical protein
MWLFFEKKSFLALLKSRLLFLFFIELCYWSWNLTLVPFLFPISSLLAADRVNWSVKWRAANIEINHYNLRGEQAFWWHQIGVVKTQVGKVMGVTCICKIDRHDNTVKVSEHPKAYMAHHRLPPASSTNRPQLRWCLHRPAVGPPSSRVTSNLAETKILTLTSPLPPQLIRRPMRRWRLHRHPHHPWPPPPPLTVAAAKPAHGQGRSGWPTTVDFSKS